MPRPHPAPTRFLPAKPSLLQLRKQAKDLLKSYLAGQHAAVTEVDRFELNPDPARFALADAQRVLARAYGFSGWACRWGRLELVELYLSRGADAVESAAEPWATPLAWALKSGHQEIAERLRSHGARD